ncbi:MAG: DUF1735 domain-containing protein [Tannerella sp.]|jgi:hypothetical protein|nr:DUF1735 domain-containing protein [Tannerella sp.]
MKNKRLIAGLLLASLFALYSCDRENPMSREQYIKQIYMVGAYNNISTFEIPYGNAPADAYVSVAVGGSLLPEKDVTVTLAHNDAAITAYNDKYMRDAPVPYRKLDASFLDMPSLNATIKTGDVFARVPFKVHTGDLHCDSLYAIALKIESVSDFEINQATPSLILNLKIINGYSGNYQLEAIKSKVASDLITLSEPTTLSAARTLTAVDGNTVRFFHEAKAQIRSGYESNDAYWTALMGYGITFSRDTETDFNIQSWGKYSKSKYPDAGIDDATSLSILDGECSYADGIFTFWYDYREGSQRYRIEGKMSK